MLRTVHDILAHMKKIRKKEAVHSIIQMAQSTMVSGMMTKNTAQGLIPIQTRTLMRETGKTINAMVRVSTLPGEFRPNPTDFDFHYSQTGSQFKGAWVNGVAQGAGQLIHSNHRYQGHWVDGNLQERVQLLPLVSD